MFDFIQRNTPKIIDNFIVRKIDSDNGYDCYEIYSEVKKVVLAGNSNLSLAMAYYRYLNEYCNVVITDGDYDISYIATTPLPEEKITYTAKQKIRARTSYEMFSLEGNYWGFDRWEKEIDFMAMHGINTALQPIGFDGVLYRTMREMGMAEDASVDFVSGPAFLMRQLTGNVAAMNSVRSTEYLERKIYIGKKITEREKELGITPGDYRVLPCTGDKDIAYEALDPMVHALEKRQPWFTPGETPDEGNLCYLLKPNGWHTYDDCFEYLYHIAPWLFAL